MWSVLLSVEKNYPDFLTSKTNIEKASSPTPKNSAFKEKQADYKKLQYEKQKLRANKFKADKKKQKLSAEEPALPLHAEAALKFFLENGFPLEKPIKEEGLNNARKKLARIFHPDLGGSHEETVILNKHYDILIDYCS
jgi:hypothetical protein